MNDSETTNHFGGLLPIEARLKKQVEFLMEIDKMKNVLRQTVLTDKSRQENDAEHSWHFALMAAILYEYADNAEVDLLRVLKMALTHDLVEIYAGDTFAFDEIGYADKFEREARAADRLFGMLPPDQGAELKELWSEFDKMETADARYAAAIDRLQPLLINYVTEGHTWRIRGGVTSDKVYKRVDVIKSAAPRLWGFIENVIEDSIKKGYLKR